MIDGIAVQAHTCKLFDIVRDLCGRDLRDYKTHEVRPVGENKSKKEKSTNRGFQGTSTVR